MVVHNSGAIEQNADVVMFIYCEEMYEPETERRGLADIILAKHRNGPTGEIVLAFDGPTTRFSDSLSVEESHIAPIVLVRDDEVLPDEIDEEDE